MLRKMAMIDFKMLENAGKAAGTAFQTLQKTYEKLPETVCRCATIGICCVSLPEMTVLEALSWCRTITLLPPDERSRLLRKFVYFYLTNPIRQPGCPFRLKGFCSIYPVRPFACRAYGLWSPENGREQTRKNRDNQQAVVEMWARFGVDIPVEQVVMDIDYCGEVEPRRPLKGSDGKLLRLLEEVYLLSTPIADLQQSFENVYQSDFSYLVAALMLGQKKAFFGKYAVVKEIVNKGFETRLAKLLNRVSSDRWQLDVSGWPGQ